MRVWRACAATGLLALALPASATPAATAAPGATVDQSNPARASACRYTGWVPDDATSWAAQTFTAGVSGSLTDVVLSLRIRTPVIVTAITPVDAAGRPVVSSPLASTSRAVTTTATYEDVAVSFSTPARVQAGKQYAIVLSAPQTAVATPDTGVAWKADLGSSTRDPSGTPCADGAYAGGRPWLSVDALGPEGDFFFQTYVVPARHLAVAAAGTGTGAVADGTHVLDCGLTCSGEFLQGETVILTATPEQGSTFSGWVGGGCTGTNPTCSLVVNADTTVTAVFTKALVRLTVRRAGAGTVTSLPAGITCGNRCTLRFAPGPVRLTAKASPGWRLARWQGACHGTRPDCRLTLAHASSVAAVFAPAARK